MSDRSKCDRLDPPSDCAVSKQKSKEKKREKKIWLRLGEKKMEVFSKVLKPLTVKFSASSR